MPQLDIQCPMTLDGQYLAFQS